MITCPECDGRGKYDYHWTECGNGQIDEWIKVDCDKCNKSGKIPLIKNAIQKDLRTPKYKLQVQKDRKRKIILKQIEKLMEEYADA